jgi:hypothetical protein
VFDELLERIVPPQPQEERRNIVPLVPLLCSE